MQKDMRERLIALVKKVPYGVSVGATFEQHFCEKIADHLIENGVILPLVKVGDKVYTIEKYCNTDPWETEKEIVKPWDCEDYCGRSDCSFMERKIEEHRVTTLNFALRIESYVGDAYFLTREEAEKKLEELSK